MWPSIDPEKLRHQITILRQIDSPGETGSALHYEPFISTYAAIATQSTAEFAQSEIVPISINYQAGILHDMRVETANGTTYAIQRIIDPQELNMVLILMCVEIKYNNPARFNQRS
jgi:head-tail adaptor